VTVLQEHTIVLENDAWQHQRRYIRANAVYAKHMVTRDYGTGQRLVICGAGPSLAQWIDPVLEKVRPHQVWGCNSALSWLYAHEKLVTHGIAVAPEDGLLEDWAGFPPVEYLVSSGVSPVVIRRLAARHRRMWFFHALLGLGTEAEELAFYRRLYPSQSLTVRGGGYNVANLAVALASGAGFRQIVLVGADCCFDLSNDPMPAEDDGALTDWKSRQGMYVDGRSLLAAYGDRVVPIEGIIAGRRVATRPDMLLSAAELVVLKRKLGRRLEIVGDTLPNWLLNLPESDWQHLLPTVKDGCVTNFKPRVMP